MRSPVLRTVAFALLLTSSSVASAQTVVGPLPEVGKSTAVFMIHNLGGRVKVDPFIPGKPIIEIFLVGSGITDAGTVQFSGLSYLEDIYLNNTRVTDVTLDNLAFNFELEKIYVGRTQVNAGLVNTVFWPELRELDLSYTDHPDIDFIFLIPLTELRKLNLTGTNVSDASLLLSVASLPKLEVLYVGQTGVTAAGIQAFQQVAPHVTVIRGFAPPRLTPNRFTPLRARP